MAIRPNAVSKTNPAAEPHLSTLQGSTSATATQEFEDKLGGGITIRVVLLSLALAVLFGYIIPIIDVKLSNTFLGAAHLPPGAIAVLLVILLIVNPLLRLVAHRFSFTRNEILTVYITCLFSCLVPGHGAENFVIPNLLGPLYFATTENKWLEFLLPNLQSWFTPGIVDGQYNESVVSGWYTGMRENESIPWGAWITPLLAWGAVIFASYIMLGCLSVMLRAQWAEREALSFPLLKLPLEMTEDVDRPVESGLAGRGLVGRFFCNPVMWIGFGLAVGIQLLRGLHGYYPEVPEVPLNINSAALFTEPPWNQIGWTPMEVWPIVVGITYLLTSEISFSLWFFYWFMKFQLIAAYYFGFMPTTLPNLIGNTGAAKAFNGYQQVGAYLGFTAIVLWTAREHLMHIVRRAFGRVGANEDEKSEALSYPLAFWGFVLSFVFIIAWSMAAGMSFLPALVIWLSYLVIAIALTRIVVEGGLLFVQQGWVPLGTFAQIFNSGPGTWLTPASIVPGSVIQASLMTDLRAFIMPSFVQSFKLAHDRRIPQKPLLALIFTVTTITLVMGLWMNVKLGYETGGLQLNSWFANSGAQQPAINANLILDGARDVSVFNLGWVGLGALLTYGMMLARSRLLWFPLHPLGYLMCLTYPMYKMWLSIFIGWAAKVTVTRFGGNASYRATVPLFLGLVLGDVLMMLVWLIADGFTGRLGHQLMPG